MDEAVQESLRAIREECQSMRQDFKAHVIEDQAALGTIGRQISEWSGQLATIKWLSGAILSAIIAYGIKHW